MVVHGVCEVEKRRVLFRPEQWPSVDHPDEVSRVKNKPPQGPFGFAIAYPESIIDKIRPGRGNRLIEGHCSGRKRTRPPAREQVVVRVPHL